MDIEQLRTLCVSLKGVTEDVKWENDLVFSIGSKMFCIASLGTPFTYSFKVPDEIYEELSVREGFAPAPYLARAKWILVSQPSKLNKEEWQSFIKQSYELIKAKLTKKVRLELGIL